MKPSIDKANMNGRLLPNGLSQRSLRQNYKFITFQKNIFDAQNTQFKVPH
jgi:hypothetical protein